MCYGCTLCGKCGKLEYLANRVTIPCFECGAAVDPTTGICTECAHQAFIPRTAIKGETTWRLKSIKCSEPVVGKKEI